MVQHDVVSGVVHTLLYVILVSRVGRNHRLEIKEVAHQLFPFFLIETPREDIIGSLYLNVDRLSTRDQTATVVTLFECLFSPPQEFLRLAVFQ